LILLAGLLAACACSRPRSTRCEQVCAREAECAEQLREEGGRDEPKVDRAECVEACNVLDRDTEGAGLVRRHLDCVTKAADCRAVLNCE
jgi:hypothetical protein